MPRKDQELVTITLQKYDERVTQGQVSYLVGPPGLKKYATYEDGKQWVPLSLLTNYQELPRNMVSFTVPVWFAKNKGFKYDSASS